MLKVERENLVGELMYAVEAGWNGVGRQAENGIPEGRQPDELELLRRENAILRAELEHLMSEGSDQEPAPSSEPKPQFAGSSPIRWTDEGWVLPDWPGAAEPESAEPEQRPAEAGGQPLLDWSEGQTEFLQSWREEQVDAIERLTSEVSTLSSEVRRLRLEFSSGYRNGDYQTPASEYTDPGEPAPPSEPDPPPAIPRLMPIIPSPTATGILHIAIRVVAIITTIVVCGGVLYFLFS